jgi:hypothetical protein
MIEEADAQWFANKAAVYEPRLVDVAVETFVQRIAHCTECTWRRFDTCTAAPARTICSVVARLPTGYCPLGKWGTPPAEADLLLPSSQVLPPPAADPIIGPVNALASQSYSTRGKRHLLCHIYPRSAGQRWKATVREIAARSQMFDTLTIGVGVDETTDTTGDVAREFLEQGCRKCLIFERPNHKALGEVPMFAELLKKTVGIFGRDDWIFYCHSKGATWAESAAPSHEWRAAMFSVCLDHPHLVERLMERASVVGAFRRFTKLPTNTIAPWHFSGTFFWFHAVDLLYGDVLCVPQCYSGVEGWPGTHFQADESACLFLDDAGDLYSSQYWDQTVRPALRIWKERVK